MSLGGSGGDARQPAMAYLLMLLPANLNRMKYGSAAKPDSRIIQRVIEIAERLNIKVSLA